MWALMLLTDKCVLETEDADSFPESGRSPEEGNGHPLQDSCLENPMDRRAWQATVHEVAKQSGSTEQPSMHGCMPGSKQALTRTQSC